jgi:flagellar biosynthesis/type III secretory pathway protein FliH
MPLSKIIRHIDASRMCLRPFTLSEARSNTSYQNDWSLMSDNVIRDQEASRFPVYTFPRLEGATASEQHVQTALAVVAEQATGASHAAEGEAQDAISEHQILPPSPSEPETLLQQAQVQAERCLVEARERAAAIEAEGYSAGLKKSEEAAYTAVQTQFASVFTSLQQAAAGCVQLRQEVLQQAEEDIVALAFHLARKIIQHEALYNRDVLVATLRRALASVMDRDHVVVRVNPADLERAMQLQTDLLHTVEGLRHLTIEGDKTVGPGGCLVESTFGEIDARLETQFEELEQRFREHYSLMSEINVS